jgi:hypothetical protein
MAAKIYQAASERILDIWDYTERTWGKHKQTSMLSIWSKQSTERRVGITSGGV